MARRRISTRQNIHLKRGQFICILIFSRERSGTSAFPLSFFHTRRWKARKLKNIGDENDDEEIIAKLCACDKSTIDGRTGGRTDGRSAFSPQETKTNLHTIHRPSHFLQNANWKCVTAECSVFSQLSGHSSPLSLFSSSSILPFFSFASFDPLLFFYAFFFYFTAFFLVACKVIFYEF